MKWSKKGQNYRFWIRNTCFFGGFGGYPSPQKNLAELRGTPHNGRKSLILAPQEIPDISGYQLGFGRRFVKAYNTEYPVTTQKIL